MATNYEINYEDERFKNVENEKQDRLTEVNDTYNNMIGQSDKFYQDQINAARDYANTQQDLQNQQTDLIVNEINQQKEQAKKDYLREQKGAYVDWQKESNRYGANTEQLASNGLSNTGYSESAQVSMYNTYQNRVSTARESYNLAMQNYDNGIAEARLANNSKLAEIAYNALQMELELSLNGFQYKNTLLLDQMNKRQDIDNNYYARWQNVLSQMNTENSLAESIRQYNEKMAYQRERDKVADKQWEKQYKLAKKAARRSSSGGGSSSGVSLSSGNANTGGTSEQTFKATYSPNLSTNSASSWFAKQTGGSALTASQLASIITTGINSKKITESDKDKILKAYGLS